MKYCLTLLFLIPALISCENKNNACIDENLFTYNSKKGICENCKDEKGYNVLDMDNIRKTKNAECTDLSNLKIVYVLDTSMIENFMELGQNRIEGYNFKGCKFSGSELFFNDIFYSNFEGADLSGINFGYATIHGTKDKFTVMPSDGNCNSTSIDSINCFQ